MLVSAAPSKNIAKNCSRSLNGVGLRFGEATLAATKPPPFTPSCSMIVCEAIGPPVIV
jgi:hypothetical protein